MSNQRIENLTLEQLYKKALAPPISGDLEAQFTYDTAKELVRRLKEMDKQLSEDGPEHMPPPLKVWLWRPAHKKAWMPACSDPLTGEECLDTKIESCGPFEIIRGMMSLDELAKHGLYIEPGFIENNVIQDWCVTALAKLNVLATRDTVDEAQWAATQLAKEAGHADATNA